MVSFELIEIKVKPNGNIVLDKKACKLIKEYQKQGYNVFVKYMLYAEKEVWVNATLKIN